MNDLFGMPVVQWSLGFIIIALGLMLFRSMIVRQIKRQAAEGSIDSRAAGMVDVQAKIIDEERQQNRLLQDDLRQANQRFAEAIEGEMGRQKDALSAVREDHRQSIERIHGRLDDCERKHTDCETRMELQGRELADLRARVTGKAA